MFKFFARLGAKGPSTNVTEPVLVAMAAFLEAPVDSLERRQCLGVFLEAVARASRGPWSREAVSAAQQAALPQLRNAMATLGRPLPAADKNAVEGLIHAAQALGLHFLHHHWQPQSTDARKAADSWEGEAGLWQEILSGAEVLPESSLHTPQKSPPQELSLLDFLLEEEGGSSSRLADATPSSGGRDVPSNNAIRYRQCRLLQAALYSVAPAAYGQVCAEVRAYCHDNFCRPDAEKHIERACYWLGTQFPLSVLATVLERLLDIFSIGHVPRLPLLTYLKSRVDLFRPQGDAQGYVRNFRRLAKILEMFPAPPVSEPVSERWHLARLFPPDQPHRSAHALFMLLVDLKNTSFYPHAEKVVTENSQGQSCNADSQASHMTQLLQTLIGAAQKHRSSCQLQLLKRPDHSKSEAKFGQEVQLLARFIAAAEVLLALARSSLNLTWSQEDLVLCAAMQDALRGNPNPPFLSRQSSANTSEPASPHARPMKTNMLGPAVGFQQLLLRYLLGGRFADPPVVPSARQAVASADTTGTGPSYPPSFVIVRSPIETSPPGQQVGPTLLADFCLRGGRGPST